LKAGYLDMNEDERPGGSTFVNARTLLVFVPFKTGKDSGHGKIVMIWNGSHILRESSQLRMIA
jgi:hypothetical protein